MSASSPESQCALLVASSGAASRSVAVAAGKVADTMNKAEGVFAEFGSHGKYEIAMAKTTKTEVNVTELGKNLLSYLAEVERGRGDRRGLRRCARRARLDRCSDYWWVSFASARIWSVWHHSRMLATSAHRVARLGLVRPASFLKAHLVIDVDRFDWLVSVRPGPAPGIRKYRYRCSATTNWPALPRSLRWSCCAPGQVIGHDATNIIHQLKGMP